MIPYHICVLGLMGAAFILQQFVPAVGGLYDARILLVPLVFLCSAVTVNVPPMLFLAFFCGFMWDAQHLLGSHGGAEDVYTNKVETMPFGYSIVLYAAMGFLMQGIQPLFREGKWHVSALLTGVAIFCYLFAEYFIITFVRGDLVVTRSLALKTGFSALLTMVFSPLVFWVLFKCAALFRYKVRYEGLKSRRRLIVSE
ncbi:MAG: hypothetical protein HKN82_03875 [Akkermansiaceae bacterium]|nr:hypothetical protein [Akkermansiaceae bacterium]NNM29192.1 hypothetical protein [Akkermansiaceae bacterium]